STTLSKNFRSSEMGALAASMSFWASTSAKGALCGWTQWTATFSVTVWVALAMAWRQARLASLRTPHPATAHSTTGWPMPSRMTPRAQGGSSTPRTASIQPPHSGCPSGGVTSQVKVARCRSGMIGFSDSFCLAASPLPAGRVQNSGYSACFVIATGVAEVNNLIVATGNTDAHGERRPMSIKTIQEAISGKKGEHHVPLDPSKVGVVPWLWSRGDGAAGVHLGGAGPDVQEQRQ